MLSIILVLLIIIIIILLNNGNGNKKKIPYSSETQKPKIQSKVSDFLGFWEARPYGKMKTNTWITGISKEKGKIVYKTYFKSDIYYNPKEKILQDEPFSDSKKYISSNNSIWGIWKNSEDLENTIQLEKDIKNKNYIDIRKSHIDSNGGKTIFKYLGISRKVDNGYKKYMFFTTDESENKAILMFKDSTLTDNKSYGIEISYIDKSTLEIKDSGDTYNLEKLDMDKF